MKITFVKKPTPLCTSFVVFAKPDYQLLKETKTVEVRIRANTKTTISTGIQWGEYSGLIGKKIEGYKYHETVYMNYLWGESQNRTYFKVSKKQGQKEYMEYLEKCLQDYFEDQVDELTVNLIDNYFVG